MSIETTALGLEGVIACETALSAIDGERGELIIAGRRVGELAREASFDELCGELWGAPGVDLGAARAEAWERLEGSLGALAGRPVMAALRGALSILDDGSAPSPEVGARLCAGLAVTAAAWHRQALGAAPTPPPAELGHAAAMLAMLRGERPAAAEAVALERYFITVVDHGLNASTFAARVVASTQAGLPAALGAALGALEGPLHGGAPGPVLDMLDAIGRPERARPWLEAELAAGRRIMGLGHRVYRVRDPRAAVLEEALAGLSAARAGGPAPRAALGAAVCEAAEALLAERKPGRPIRANVEFMTALLLEALGIPRGLFTALFAVSRSAGWVAHALEERARGRLIRPRARYIGPRPAP